MHRKSAHLFSSLSFQLALDISLLTNKHGKCHMEHCLLCVIKIGL